MPTYDYKCFACDHQFELLQSIMADPIKKCPKCGKLKVKRLLGTGAGLIFKGSGFYITDYRDKSYTDKAKAENGGETKSGGEAKGGETKPAESKPAEKSTTKSEVKPAAPASKSDAKKK